MVNPPMSEPPDAVAMRPFVPARDYQVSVQFYTELGFRPFVIGSGLASMHLGQSAFLLQSLDAWWKRIDSLNLCDRYDVKAPIKPNLQSWGLTVSYVWDPSGVLWRYAQDPEPEATQSI